MESPAPDPQDPHSSEEELEVINNSPRPLLKSNCQPEKRKWSQVGETCACRCTPENEENISRFGNLTPSTCCSKCYGVSSTGISVVTEEAVHSGSSDEEVHNLLASMATPVQFRTSPPLEALKPGGRTPNNSRIRTMSPPAKQLHYEVSPRKRSRHTKHAHMPRPFLDFEKMQQLTTHSVTAWSHTADHGGELSVFCW
nr:uncharacterized protein LOC111415636 [Onthophagus taurus]